MIYQVSCEEESCIYSSVPDDDEIYTICDGSTNVFLSCQSNEGQFRQQKMLWQNNVKAKSKIRFQSNIFEYLRGQGGSPGTKPRN